MKAIYCSKGMVQFLLATDATQKAFLLYKFTTNLTIKGMINMQILCLKEWVPEIKNNTWLIYDFHCN